jgi:hypothetical protein
MNEDNKWSLKKEKLLKYWQEECRLYVWLHNQNSQYYSRLDKYISIPSILITAVSGTTLVSTTNLNETDNLVYSVIMGICLIIGTFLQSVRDFYNFKGMSNDNENCGKLYQSIVIDIDEQLNQEYEDRECGNIFLKKIKISRNDIIKNSPQINNRIWKKLKKSFEIGEMINLFSSSFFHNYVESIQDLEDNLNLDLKDDNQRHPHNRNISYLQLNKENNVVNYEGVDECIVGGNNKGIIEEDKREVKSEVVINISDNFDRRRSSLIINKLRVVNSSSLINVAENEPKNGMNKSHKQLEYQLGRM